MKEIVRVDSKLGLVKALTTKPNATIIVEGQVAEDIINIIKKHEPSIVNCSACAVVEVSLIEAAIVAIALYLCALATVAVIKTLNKNGKIKIKIYPPEVQIN